MSLVSIEISNPSDLHPDGLSTVATKPLDISPSGSLIIYEHNFVTGSSGTYSSFILRNTIGEDFTLNFNELISNSNAELIEISKVIPDWNLHGDNRFLVLYKDLTDTVSAFSGANKLGLVENNRLVHEDVIALVTGEVSNASIQNAAFSEEGSKFFLETSANNITTDDFDLDTNGLRDIYQIDLSAGGIKRLSLIDGLEADEDVKLVGFFENNNVRKIIFETKSNQFSRNDQNDLNDIYELSFTEEGYDFHVLSKSFEGAASGVSLQKTTLDQEFVIFSSTSDDLVPGDINFREDLFSYNLLSEKLTQVSSIFDVQNLSEDVQYIPHGVSAADGYLATITNSGFGLVENQIVEINPDDGTYTVISKVDNELGNDISLEAVASSGRKSGDVIAFYTEATNLNTEPMHLLIDVRTEPLKGINVQVFSGERVLSAGIEIIFFTTDGETITMEVEDAAGHITIEDAIAFTDVQPSNITSDDLENLSLTDAILVLEDIVNISSLNGAGAAAADVNDDGKISLTDAIMILEDIVNISRIETFDLVDVSGTSLTAITHDGDYSGGLTFVQDGDVNLSGDFIA